MKFKSFLLFLCCFPYTLAAQLVLGGHVIDAENKQPIPFANVSLTGQGKSTITNDNGDFELILPSAAINDSVRISFLGYSVKLLPANALTGSKITIALTPTGLKLKEVSVTAIDPVKLIKKAIGKIPLNYKNSPYQLRGFYRTATTRDQEYMQLSEAVFDIFSKGYANKDNDRFYLERVRYIRDEDASHGIDLGMKPKDLYDYDIIRTCADNRLLSKDGLANHTFYLRGIADYKGTPAYQVDFDQRNGVKHSLYKGTMYIDTVSLAILNIQYGLSAKGLPYNSYGDAATKALMAILDVHIATRQETINVEYQKVNGYYLLASVMSNTSLHFRSTRKHYNFISNTRVNYIITAIDATRRPDEIDGKRIGDNQLIEFQTTPLDAAFWRKNTIILPDFDAEGVAKELMAKNNGNSLKKNAEQLLDKLPPQQSLRIDSLLTYYNRNGRFNGTALIKTKEGVLLSKSYGYANIDQQIPADSNTQYRIGSLSKSFTALVILQLYQEGRLHLTDSIKQYLPDYPNGNITIAQLLSHQSGIPNYTNNPDYLTRILHQAFTLKELVANFCSDSTEFTPGTAFRYSNSNYVLLAYLAEIIGGKPFSQLLKERIFIPAGMTDTYLLPDKPASTHPATGYLYGKEEPAYNAANTVGAGGIVSTAADLLRWSAALTANKLLSPALMDTMCAPHAAYSDWDAYYGYGCMIDRKLFEVSKEKHKIVYHPGTDFGFYTMYLRQEDKGIVIILLNNTGDFPRFDLADMILTQLK